MQYAYLSSSCLTQCKLFHIFISNSQWFVFHHILVTISRVPCAVNFVMCALLLDLPYSVKKTKKNYVYMYVCSVRYWTYCGQKYMSKCLMAKYRMASQTQCKLWHYLNPYLQHKQGGKQGITIYQSQNCCCMYVCMYVFNLPNADNR